MVLDVHGHALVGRIEAGPLGHGPRHEHAIEFQPEVVVQARGRMLLDDERQRLAPLCCSPRGSAVIVKSRFAQ